MKELKELFAAQKQTPLGLVNKIFFEEKFVCPIEQEVNEEAGDVLLGELSDYEKAIVLACQQIAEKNNNAAEEAEKNGLKQDKGQSYLDKLACEALSNLLWNSIHQNIGKPAIDSSFLTIRKDWKVVSAIPEPSFEVRCIGIRM